MAETVTLSGEDFWRLRALSSEAELAEFKAKTLIAKAGLAADEALKTTAAKYGFAVTEGKRLRLDEQTLSLILEPGP